MVDIVHKVGIKSASLDDVYKALTTPEGLSAWWSPVKQGGGEVGGVIKFSFVTMKVLELHPGSEVLWQAIDGPQEWIGTQISFALKPEGDYTIVLFKHQDWREPTEMMRHCSTKWAIFLMSLKSLLETGKGAPRQTM